MWRIAVSHNIICLSLSILAMTGYSNPSSPQNWNLRMRRNFGQPTIKVPVWAAFQSIFFCLESRWRVIFSFASCCAALAMPAITRAIILGIVIRCWLWNKRLQCTGRLQPPRQYLIVSFFSAFVAANSEQQCGYFYPSPGSSVDVQSSVLVCNDRGKT